MLLDLEVDALAPRCLDVRADTPHDWVAGVLAEVCVAVSQAHEHLRFNALLRQEIKA
mgnify:CR=1 FL=1